MSGKDSGAVPVASHTERVPARRTGLAGDDERTPAQRYPGRRDGTGQNHSDDCAAGVPGVREMHLGSTSDHRANQRDAELGDGAEEVVSGIQNPHLLRFC